MDIVIRSAIAFVMLWLLSRASGRATLGELSSFDLLLFITMGDLIQQGVTGEDHTLTGGLMAIGTVALLAVGMSYIIARWPRLGRALEGSPVVLVSYGKPMHTAMRRQRVAQAELLSAARESGFDTLRDVRMAVLEQDGKISFFRQDQSPTE